MNSRRLIVFLPGADLIGLGYHFAPLRGISSFIVRDQTATCLSNKARRIEDRLDAEAAGALVKRSFVCQQKILRMEQGFAIAFSFAI
jgi:hypothetical protein